LLTGRAQRRRRCCFRARRTRPLPVARGGRRRRAMEWVRAENAKTAAVLESDPRYPRFFKDAFGPRAGPRTGSPRRASSVGRSSIIGRTPITLRGILAAHHTGRVSQVGARVGPRCSTWTRSRPPRRANWFLDGAWICQEPGATPLHGGSVRRRQDAVTFARVRHTAGALRGGRVCVTPRQAVVGLAGDDTLLVAREWSPGELTRSGYPFVVKRLTRGQTADRRPSRCFAVLPTTSVCHRRAFATVRAIARSWSCAQRPTTIGNIVS
jgi:prolyl oligopeptidase